MTKAARANTLRFTVEIEGYDLGSFTAVDGLSAHYEGITHQEGGENTYVHFLPTRLVYDNVKISRPLDAQSKLIGDWFRSLAAGTPKGRRAATIVAFDSQRREVARWVFQGCIPVKYQAPAFSTETGKVAIEVLEFAHKGLMAGGGVG